MIIRQSNKVRPLNFLAIVGVTCSFIGIAGLASDIFEKSDRETGEGKTDGK